jgi:hypothetical protein
MKVALPIAIVGLAIIASFSTPASAWECMARSTNGAVGLGSGIILGRAQKSAIQKCVAAGGNASGYACSIRYCR